MRDECEVECVNRRESEEGNVTSEECETSVKVGLSEYDRKGKGMCRECGRESLTLPTYIPFDPQGEECTKREGNEDNTEGERRLMTRRMSQYQICLH